MDPGTLNWESVFSCFFVVVLFFVVCFYWPVTALGISGKGIHVLMSVQAS